MKNKNSRSNIKREIKRKVEEEAKEKAHQQPYKNFKALSEKIAGYRWDDEKLTIYPKTEFDIESEELPEADCILATTYYPGYFADMMKETEGVVNPPSPRIELLLHALYETKANTDENAPPVITDGYDMPMVLLNKLKDYSPKIIHGKKDSKKFGKLNKHGAKSHARSELVKHLNSIPFLEMDKNHYWEFAVAAYEKFQLGGLMSFILEEGKKKNWVGPADQTTHPGWSIMSFKALVQLCHMYPPIKESGAKLSFKVFQISSGYYLHEILLSLTRDMEPARRARSLVTYHNMTVKGAEEYGELIPFLTVLLFRDNQEEEEEKEEEEGDEEEEG